MAPLSARLLAPIVVLAGLAACGGDGGGGTPPPTQGCQPVLGAGTGIPGTTLAVAGLPASTEAPTAIVSAGGVTAPAVIFRDSVTGALSLVVPVHPGGGAAGGTVTLTVTAGGEACRPATLTIAPLPEAPGAAAATVGALQASIGTAAAAYGISEAQLRGDTAGIPPTLRALWVAQRMVDHPDNPNSLKAIVAGTAPALGGRSLDADLLGRLMTSTGLRAAIEAHAASLAASLAPQTSDSSLVEIGSRPTASPAFARGAARAPLAPTTIERGAELAYWMKRQGQAQDRTSESVQNMVTGLELLLAAVAVTGPAGAVVAGAATAAVMSVYITESYLAGVLPRELVDLQVEAFPTDYPEDWALEGHWRARVSARSTGVGLSLSSFLEEGASALPSGRLFKVLKKFPELEAYLQEMWGKAASALTASLGIPGTVIEIAPRVWAGIDVTDQRYTRRELSAPGVIQLSGLGVDWAYYRPVAPGQTTLTVSTFAATLNSQLTRAIPLRVQQIAIQVDAERTQMRPGTEQQLMVGVSGALDLEVDWTSNGCGTVVEQPGAFATFTAPDAPTTCTVTARHHQKTQRSGSIQIQVANVVTVDVSPTYPTLLRGEQRQFTATVVGASNTAVTWAASRGSITPQGYFTAPEDTGFVTLTATSAADPSKSGFARVHVVGRYVAYEVLVLDVPATDGLPSNAYALNNRGQAVVGGYLWENGSSTDLGAAFAGVGVMQLFPRTISESGVVIGSARMRFNCYGSPEVRGFLWSGGSGTLVNGATSPSQGECGTTQIMGINESGRAVGTYFRRSPFGSSTVFTLEGGVRVDAYCGGHSTFMDRVRIAGITGQHHYAGINEDPNIPITRPFYCDEPGSDRSYANDTDLYATLPEGFHPGVMHWDGKLLGTTGAGPALWTAGGSLQRLTLPAADAASASAVNRAGDVVGMLARGSTNITYLYRSGAAYDLNLLIPEEWTFQNPVDINDSGWILGSGFRNGTHYPALLLRPIASVAPSRFGAARIRRR